MQEQRDQILSDQPADTATDGDYGDAAPRSDRAVISYLAFLGVMLATGIDIALPAFTDIDESFGGGTSVSLVVTLYVLGMAAGQLVWGPLADRFGRVPVLQAGIALYAVGAIGSALAPSFGLLLVARLFWGLGAAAPAGLRGAIARDLYSGDAMARVVTIMMAVFLLGPVIVPVLGELILQVAPWPVVFWVAAITAVIGSVWCFKFGETLDPANVRPLEFRPLGEAVKIVAQTRVTIGHIMATTLFSGAFFIFLGSSQPVFENVFDRGSSFAVMFALIGLVTIPFLIASDRAIERVGARRVAMTAGAVVAIVAVAGIVPALMSDGQPNFWLWFGWVTIVSSMTTVATPPMHALALEPMGELAGTASSLLYFVSFAGGAGLAAIFDAQVESTVTPFVIGFALYAAIGYAFMWWAGPGEPAASPQAPGS